MALFGRKVNPATQAMPYYDKAEGVARTSYDPYINRGKQSGDILGGEYGKMSQNPMDVINDIMGKYQPSEGYKFKQDEMGRAAANTAAAGGMRGTPQDQQQQQQLTQSLLNQDMQDWLKNVLGIKTQGLQGEKGLYDVGFGATQNQAGDLENILGTKGQLEFQGAREQNARKDALKKALFGGLGTGAGFLLGGPMGSSLGGKLGSGIFNLLSGGGLGSDSYGGG